MMSLDCGMSLDIGTDDEDTTPTVTRASLAREDAGSTADSGDHSRAKLATVIPRLLYFGGYKQANHLDSVVAHGITAFLCVAREAPKPSFVTDADVTSGAVLFQRLDMVDGGATKLADYLPDAFAFIDQCAASGRRVMVYCAQGYSRSASVVIAYLMRARHLSYSEALKIARQERRADPNIFFCMELEKMSYKGSASAATPSPAPSSRPLPSYFLGPPPPPHALPVGDECSPRSRPMSPSTAMGFAPLDSPERSGDREMSVNVASVHDLLHQSGLLNVDEAARSP